MVRKKRKGVVKQAEASGAAGSAKPRVELERALPQAPEDAALPFALAASEVPVETADAQVTTLRQWYALLCSARSLFDQLKMLQLFRSKCNVALAVDGDHGAFAAAAWRMAFRLYVAPKWEPVRKNFFLILKALADANHKLGDALKNAASDELQRYLRELLGSAQHAELSPDEIVDVFDAMLLISDFQFLAGILVELPEQEDGAPGLAAFVRFCSQRLDDLALPVTRYRQNEDTELSGDGDAEDASTSVVLIASERCGHALKNVILLTTMKEALYTRIAASPLILNDFFAIAESCAKILQTSVVHKDLLTQSALAYCLTLRLLLHCAQGHAVDKGSLAKQLLAAIYPDQHSAMRGSTKLDAHLKAAAAGFGELSRLAMFRGVLSSLTDSELASTIEAEDNSTMMNTLFKSAQQYCQHESLNVRLYAFQVLEAFLRRAVLIAQGQNCDSEASIATSKTVAFDTMVSLTAGVILNWGHNSKKVNQFMPPMFTHIVNYFALTGDFDIWKNAIISKLIGLPSHSRAKYGALSILAVKYGVKNMLAEYPSLMKSVLVSVGNKDVSAAAASLFSQFLDAEEAGAANPWLMDIVHALISSDPNLRERVATYVMPLLLKKSPSVVVELIDTLRETLEKEQVIADREIALWAIIEVVKYARKRIAPEKLAGVSIHEVEIGLRHQRAETRGAAFEAICASLKSTNAPTPEELALIKAFLVMSSKETASGSRMNTMIGLKNVFFRVKESQRLARKTSKQGESAESTQGAEFLEWVQQFVVSSLYAGSSPQRTILGLEVMLLYLQVFGTVDAVSGSSTRFLEPQVVSVLLNVLVSSWDVIRSLAFAILELYPTDLPGYSSEAELTALLKWSLMLCISPRQRESDAGALFMRILFKRSVAIQHFRIELVDDVKAAQEAVKSSEASFVLKLSSLVLKRLRDSATDKSGQGESPLVHGLLLSLRYIVESVDFDSIAKSSDKILQNEWQTALHQVFRCVDNAMHASLSVVGDATSGVGDEELSANFAGVVGEVSSVSKSAASALKVDCRGHLIIENNDDDEDSGADSGQRAVVGSWLAARECGAIVDTLMKRVPLPRSNSSLDTQPQFFTTEMAERGGEMLLNSLFELKHKGAVATAYQSFEGVCKSFLAHAERNTVLGGLPHVWADRLLNRLETSQQVFILRRSSGFAFSFVAILRAEPRNSAAVILPVVMGNLLRLAALDTDKIALTTKHEDHHLVWRSRVHALNILKLICQDAVLADDVSVYVSRMLEVAIFGFDCESWAVRNSSMMLFAATTQRAIGDKRIADGASTHKISSADVFSRFPQLSEFLHRELVRFTTEVNSTATRGTTPPGLFPVLMFLSRLKSSEDEDDASLLAEGVPLSKFIPIVMKCAEQPTNAIRQMAAKVLASIVRDSEVVNILESLIAGLPNGVTSRDASTSSKPTTPKSSNYVHGLIAQIHQIARRYLCNSGSSKPSSQDTAALSVAQRAIAEIVAAKALSAKMWLASSSVCAAIRGEFLELVDVFVSFCGSRAGRALAADSSSMFQHSVVDIIEAMQSMCVLALQERCGAPSPSSAYYRQHHAPGMYVVDRTLVSIFFGIWRLESVQHKEIGEDQIDLAARLLTSPVLQVRKRSIKKVSNLLVGAGVISVPLSTAIKFQTVLATQLLVEVHPKIKARNLQLSVFFLEKKHMQLGKDLVENLLQKATEILEVSSDADVVAPALELLALLAPNNPATSSWRQLREQIVARSDEKQPLALRRAAAKALGHCDVLSRVAAADVTDERVEFAVDSWLSAIKLLQDDDSNVRLLVNEAVSKALEISTPTSDTLVLPLAIEHLVSSFGKTQYGFSRVMEMVSRLIDAPAEIEQYLRSGASKDLGATDLSSRIFEAESDNYYAEPDLVAQNLVYQLVLKRDQLFDTHKFEQTVIGTATKALYSLENALSRGASAAEWLGGVTYYPGVFPALQNGLIAAAAVLGYCDSPSESASSLRELSHGILARESALHPLTKQALQIVASGGKHQATELLFLTPHWAALKA